MIIVLCRQMALSEWTSYLLAQGGEPPQYHAYDQIRVHPMRHIDPTMSRYPKRHRTQD